MDIVSRLPLTPIKKDSVWVIVDRLTKSVHFILVRTDFSLHKLAKLYISKIILEDMLRNCVIDFRGNWEEYLPLAEFAYNNSFQSNIQMAPYEALDRLKVAYDKKKSYTDLKRREIKYSVGDFVFLKLELPRELDCIHIVFHISMLRRYCSDPMHIVPVEEIEVQPDLTFEEEPV
ncbi:uncharacterized protein LOC128296605 [Gossypium arboreum]|uniref:uncharacterized protein LOC128296605 n=1 Tax=Gossypium arboreum TaxID=29729 RepID=UPI0022F1D125|nr:uncharacterized protein LOC128296605 [Gossypium arboreum]